MNRKLVAVGVAALAVAGAGGAIAATGVGTPQQESKAILDDAAKQLGVDSAKLSDALKTAMANRVDAAVAAGDLTAAHGAELKARIQDGEVPLLAFGRGFGHGPGHHRGGHFGAKLEGAAAYLGLTEAALRTQLESGKSLADIAKAQGKSVDGLVSALTDGAKSKLDAAVKAGDLSRAEADDMLSGLKERLTDLVNGTFPDRGGRFERHAPDGAGAFAPAVFGTAA